MQIREIMSQGVEVVSHDALLKEAALKMKTLDVGLMPVCDGSKLQGILTDRDITIRATAEGHDPLKTKVSEIMSKDVAYCFEDQDIDEAMKIMEARQIRRLPILNREKRLVGIVSLGDIALHAPKKEAGETLKEISEPRTAPR